MTSISRERIPPKVLIHQKNLPPTMRIEHATTYDMRQNTGTMNSDEPVTSRIMRANRTVELATYKMYSIDSKQPIMNPGYSPMVTRAKP